MKQSSSKPSKVTSNDVAERAGVSRWTVSRALTPGKSISESVRQRVLAAAEELGYKPNLLARSLSTQKTGLIAVVVDCFINHNVSKLMDRLTAELQSQGLRAVVLNVTHYQRVTELVEHADQLQCDGVIFLGATLTDDFVSLTSKIQRIPIVIAFRDCDLPEPFVFTTEDYAAGEEIAELLLQQKASRFAYFGGPPGVSTFVRRQEGFEAKLKQSGITLTQTFHCDNYDQFLACSVFERYLADTDKSKRVDAIFCENDAIAFGVLDAMRTHECLQEIAVVGFDDVPYAASKSYQLTTYAPPVDKIIKETVAVMLGESPESKRMNGNMVVRASHLLGQ